MARTTPLKIVIAYDGYTDGLRAWELSERLASRFHGEFPVDRDLWKFDLLCDPNPQVRQASLAAVAQAEMVLIAAGGLEDLPAAIREWIESWPPRRETGWSALVASVGPEAQSGAPHSPMSAYLRQRAEGVGMEFFCNVEDRLAPQEAFVPAEAFKLEQCGAGPV